MTCYRIPSATFVLDRPLEQEGLALTHFVRSLFVMASSEERALALLSDHARADGATLLGVEGIEAADPREIPADGLRAASMTQDGVAWQSGRVFFPAA